MKQIGGKAHCRPHDGHSQDIPLELAIRHLWALRFDVNDCCSPSGEVVRWVFIVFFILSNVFELLDLGTVEFLHGFDYLFGFGELVIYK